MSTPDPDEIFARTLDDGRLSRAEARALRDLAAELSADRRAQWRSRAFVLARDRASAQPDETLRWLEDVVRALDAPSPDEASVCVHFSPGEACRRQLVALLRNAERSADLCVFTITDDEISEAIFEAHTRGVAVRVVTDDEKSWDKGSDVDRLIARGVPVRVDRSEAHMHHKFAIFDDARLANGSYNWTRSAASHNQENLVVCETPALLRAFRAEFEKLWAQFA